MTLPDLNDVVREFGAHLPANLRRGIEPTTTMRLDIYRAVTQQGWSVKALAHEAGRDHGTAINPAAIMTKRLAHCATHPPIKTGPAVFTQPVPWCGHCQEAGRFALDPDTGAPIGRCPDCYTPPS